MDDPTAQSTDGAHGDVTLDVGGDSPSLRQSSVAASAERGPHAPVAVVEGSDVGLTAETASLLRRRLRLASLTLFFGLLVFLPQHYLATDFSQPGARFLFGFHVVITLVLGTVGAHLCQRRGIPMFRLRVIELVTFGLVAVFFLALQHFAILMQCRELAMIRQEQPAYSEVRVTMPGGPWLLLVFTYALFIPNTWRRAAAVIGAIAAMPIVMVLVTWLAYPVVREVLGWQDMTALPLMMAVAAVTGLFGVDTIGSLRRQAFEARQVGQYRLKQRIGAGGMGEVFLAEHQLLKRRCVIKLIRPDKAGDEKVLLRFQREVRATARLTHWNTIDIFDYGVTDDGTFYYVMEHLAGLSLADLVERFGPLPPERVIYLLRQACDALREAHSVGLVHRDIKPGNIFAAQRGGVYDVAKLLDFGLVKPVLDAEEGSIHLTAEGSITGSPLFMSPEQATGEGNPDARSDIYSLGAVGYYLLAGRPPFGGNRPIKVMIAHVRDKVVPPSEHRADIPADLEEVILRCLAKRPEDRYPDAPSLAEALDACESSGAWNRARAAQWWQQQQPQEAMAGV